MYRCSNIDQLIDFFHFKIKPNNRFLGRQLDSFVKPLVLVFAQWLNFKLTRLAQLVVTMIPLLCGLKRDVLMKVDIWQRKSIQNFISFLFSYHHPQTAKRHKIHISTLCILFFFRFLMIPPNFVLLSL